VEGEGKGEREGEVRGRGAKRKLYSLLQRGGNRDGRKGERGK
jgi:hypothetical protein